MRATFKKDIVIDYTKEEFLKKYGITDNFFKDSIKDLSDHFHIEREKLKRNESYNGTYEIQYDIADVLGMMLKNFKISPFYDNRNNIKKKTIEDINKYNEKIIDEIDKLPQYMQFHIKSNDTYRFNLVLLQLMPILIDRLTVLFKTIIEQNNMNIGTVLGNLIEYVDILIDKRCKDDLVSEWSNKNIITNRKKEKKYANGYNIDSVLRSTFDKFYRISFSKLDKSISEQVKSDITKLKNSNDADIVDLRKKYENSINEISVNEQLLKNINRDIKIQKDNVKELKKINRIPEKMFEEDNITHINNLRKMLYFEDKGIRLNTTGIDFNPFLFNLSKIDDEKIKEKSIINYAKEIVCIEEASYKNRCKLFDDIDRNNGLEIKKILNIVLGQMLINLMNKEKKINRK